MATWRKPHTIKPDFSKQNLPDFPATKFFDQLSFVGNELVSCFILETAKGYVLLDCMNPDLTSRNCVEKAFEDLGFDIHDLYAIVISHGHGDHYGCCDYFKEKYGAKLYMSRIDWEFARNMPERFPWPPITFEVDHFLEDGEELDFGDVKIRCVFTPGHSIGCFSFIIPVTDEGRPHKAALWGGSGLLPDSNVDDYEASLKKFSAICAEEHVDAEIATHPCLDQGLARLRVVREIVDGVPNPFVIGEEGYRYYETQFYNLVKRAREGEKPVH